MNKRRQVGVVLLVAAVAGFAGYYFNRAGVSLPATEAASQKLLSAPLNDLDGKSQTLAHWKGKVLVVNFWATWCLPCRTEIPALIKIQTKHLSNGVEIVGIAFDDVSKVRDYAAEMRINYSLLMGAAQTLALTKDLGNPAGVLPFTVVLDRSGKAVYRHTGALTEASLDAVLRPLL